MGQTICYANHNSSCPLYKKTILPIQILLSLPRKRSFIIRFPLLPYREDIGRIWLMDWHIPCGQGHKEHKIEIIIFLSLLCSSLLSKHLHTLGARGQILRVQIMCCTQNRQEKCFYATNQMMFLSWLEKSIPSHHFRNKLTFPPYYMKPLGIWLLWSTPLSSHA